MLSEHLQMEKENEGNV